MRKIVSKDSAERKEKAKRWTISILLLSIMVLSVFGIVVDSMGKTGSNSNQVEYNGATFNYRGERWFFSVDGKEFVISNPPGNLTEVPAEKLNPLEAYANKPLYISLEDRALESQIYYNFYKSATRIQPACLDEKNCSGDFPIKTCEDNFIILKEGNETGITQKDNCVFIEAPEKEMQNAVDVFILNIAGINL